METEPMNALKADLLEGMREYMEGVAEDGGDASTLPTSCPVRPVTSLEPMDISDLSIAELRALHGVLEHWLRAWDWECPTLFGFERSDLSKLLEDWPLSLQTKPPFAALAVQGVLRETLHGASTIAADRLPAVCGLSRADLECLAQHLWPRLDAAQN